MSVQVVTSDFVEVDITNSLNDIVCMQKRFPKSITISDFKSKLEMITGGTANNMILQLLKRKGDLVCLLDNDNALLGSYPIENGMLIHVISDASYIVENVEKFELSKEEYTKRSDTVHSFLKNNKLGKYDENRQKELEEQSKAKELALEEKLKTINIGGRCLVQVKGHPSRKGTVMYKGEVEGLDGIFVGVKYDEPLGKNDGSLNGKRYFECAMKYGGFVKPAHVDMGDYPEDELDLEEI